MYFKVLKAHPDAKMPVRQTIGSSGLDLFSCEDRIISPGKACICNTGIKVIVPIGYEIQIRPRSGLAVKHSITVLNTPGTIDSDYRGEIGVILINHGIDEYLVHKGDRIAQAVVCEIELADPKEITAEEFNTFTTERGSGGFGHTGNT